MIFNGRKIKDISGLRSGKLVAIKPVNPQERYGDKSRKVILWECQCDCGSKTILRTNRITSGDIKSCGCAGIQGKRKRGYKLSQFPYRNGFENYKGLVPLWYCSRVKNGAKKRKIYFDITPSEMSDLFIRQNKRCVFTDLELKFGITSHDTEITTASLERIDSSLGYVKDNIQWVHKKVNWLKGTRTNIEVVDFCRKIKDIVVMVVKKSENI